MQRLALKYLNAKSSLDLTVSNTRWPSSTITNFLKKSNKYWHLNKLFLQNYL
jgi:hypothetical protein